MAYINLTPHSVEVYTANAFEGLQKVNATTWIADSVYADQAVAVFPSQGEARISVSVTERPNGPGDIPMVASVYGAATGIPDSVQPDDILIVSLPMQSMAKASNHPLAGQMVAPYQVVRLAVDGKPSGNVLGCMGFTK